MRSYLHIVVVCCFVLISSVLSAQQSIQDADARFDAGDYDAAISFYRVLIRVYQIQHLNTSELERKLSIAKDCQNRLMTAMNYFNQNDFVTAASCFMRIKSINPKDPFVDEYLNRCEVAQLDSRTIANGSKESIQTSIQSGKRIIYSKEATIKVGEQVFAQLSEGRIENWEIRPTVAQYVAATSNGSITALKTGSVSVWGYIGTSPKLFKLSIVDSESEIAIERAPYQVTSKVITLRVGDQITALLSEGPITNWEINKHFNEYISAEGIMLRAKKAGNVTAWGYVDGSPKLFKITIQPK